MNRAYRLSNSAPERALKERIANGFLPRGWIDGLILSNNAIDAVNDIDITAGVARSTSNIGFNGRSTRPADQRDLEITQPITKQLDVSWAPGNGGMRSASALADGTWHIFVIGGRGVPDDIFAHNATDPSAVLPSGYTAFRRIGSIVRATSIRPFIQHADYFRWKTIINDLNVTNPGSSAVTRTLSVPVGIRVIADLLIGIINNNASVVSAVLVTDLDATDDAPASFFTQTAPVQSASTWTNRSMGPVQVRTNASAQVRTRLLYGGTDTQFAIYTLGWWDQRDRNV
jgi:hypothetical protein